MNKYLTKVWKLFKHEPGVNKVVWLEWKAGAHPGGGGYEHEGGSETWGISGNEYLSHQGMSLDMLSAGEELATDVAAEGTHARVDDQMSL